MVEMVERSDEYKKLLQRKKIQYTNTRFLNIRIVCPFVKLVD